MERQLELNFPITKLMILNVMLVSLGKYIDNLFEINQGPGQQFQEKYYTEIPVDLCQNPSTGVFTW
jgi:hypothetical protein